MPAAMLFVVLTADGNRIAGTVAPSADADQWPVRPTGKAEAATCRNFDTAVAALGRAATAQPLESSSRAAIQNAAMEHIMTTLLMDYTVRPAGTPQPVVFDPLTAEPIMTSADGAHGVCRVAPSASTRDFSFAATAEDAIRSWIELRLTATLEATRGGGKLHLRDPYHGEAVHVRPHADHEGEPALLVTTTDGGKHYPARWRQAAAVRKWISERQQACFDEPPNLRQGPAEPAHSVSR